MTPRSPRTCAALWRCTAATVGGGGSGGERESARARGGGGGGGGAACRTHAALQANRMQVIGHVLEAVGEFLGVGHLRAVCVARGVHPAVLLGFVRRGGAQCYCALVSHKGWVKKGRVSNTYVRVDILVAHLRQARADEGVPRGPQNGRVRAAVIKVPLILLAGLARGVKSALLGLERAVARRRHEKTHRVEAHGGSICNIRGGAHGDGGEKREDKVHYDGGVARSCGFVVPGVLLPQVQVPPPPREPAPRCQLRDRRTHEKKANKATHKCVCSRSRFSHSPPLAGT
jgi:hypothetical protein